MHRDVIVRDRDEALSEDYCLLQLEVWGGAVSPPPASPGQSPGVGAGGEAPGSSDEPAVYSIKKGPKSRQQKPFSLNHFESGVEIFIYDANYA